MRLSESEHNWKAGLSQNRWLMDIAADLLAADRNATRPLRCEVRSLNCLYLLWARILFLGCSGNDWSLVGAEDL